MAGVLESWHDYFVAQAGASAALAGLLFVALSINIPEIIKNASLPARAFLTLLLLIGTVIESLTGLWPHLTPQHLGAVLTAESAFVWLWSLRYVREAMRTPKQWIRVTTLNVALVEATLLLAVAGSLMLALGNAFGPYVLAASALVAIGVGFFYAWILMVEILR